MIPLLHSFSSPTQSGQNGSSLLSLYPDSLFLQTSVELIQILSTPRHSRARPPAPELVGRDKINLDVQVRQMQCPSGVISPFYFLERLETETQTTTVAFEWEPPRRHPGALDTPSPRPPIRTQACGWIIVLSRPELP